MLVLTWRQTGFEGCVRTGIPCMGKTGPLCGFNERIKYWCVTKNVELQARYCVKGEDVIIKDLRPSMGDKVGRECVTYV